MIAVWARREKAKGGPFGKSAIFLARLWGRGTGGYGSGGTVAKGYGSGGTVAKGHGSSGTVSKGYGLSGTVSKGHGSSGIGLRNFGLNGAGLGGRRTKDKAAIKNLRILYPGPDFDKRILEYRAEKIRMVLMLVFIGSILALAMGMYQQQEDRVNGKGEIRRNTWKEGSFLVELAAESAVTENLSIMIEPKSLTAAEAARLADEVFAQLPGVILQNNAALEQITGSLKLVSRLDDYPFEINWDSDRLQVVKPTGEVVNDRIGPEGETVVLTAALTWQSPKEKIAFTKEIPLVVYPKPPSGREQWRESLLQAVADGGSESADSDFFTLPLVVEGQPVTWRERIGTDNVYLWVISIMAAGALFYAKDDELRKKVRRRNRQAEDDYPELVRKMALYLGAGMTIKKAWRQMTDDYLKHKDKEKSRVLYEEMLISLRELNNGWPEQEVYFRFGKRLGGNRYRKFMGLLSSHLQKGNRNLLTALREEADLALEERKNLARVTGEEMGTRLLLPMMLMLLVVVVIIMVPAFEMF